MGKKKTQEQYVAEVAIVNPNIEVVETYVGNNIKILHRCKIDGHEWSVSPSSILQGHGCPMCSGNVKKTHEEYVRELSIKNPSIIVIGKYVNSTTKILHKCVKDGYEWLALPLNTLRGKGCPVCGGTMQKSHEQYVNELKLKNPSIIAVDKYINHTTKIMHKCLMHDYEWEASPQHILEGCGCPICRSEKLSNKFKRSTKEYIECLHLANKDIIAIEEYVNARTPIKHKCTVCGWEWNVLPDALLHGHGCPQCNSCSKSTGEKAIANWLDDYNIKYETQKTFDGCKDKYALRFDFYLPDYNILIEYNGKQHYEPIDYFGGKEAFENQILRDRIKENYCSKNDIMLIKIPYCTDIHEELNNLHKLIIDKEVAVS